MLGVTPSCQMVHKLKTGVSFRMKKECSAEKFGAMRLFVFRVKVFDGTGHEIGMGPNFT
jgi:hypothetical protein